MALYRIYGRALESDLPLPELTLARPSIEREGGAAAGTPDIVFQRGRVAEPDGQWFDIWPVPDGRAWVRGIKVPSGYVIRYVDRADFLVDSERRTITGDDDTDSGCPEEMMRHFLLDQVVPLMLSLEAPVLHASSVVIGGAMAAFIGPGGAGKSTLAVALGRLGHPLGSDDGLLLACESERIVGIPAYAGARLCADSAHQVASAGLPVPAAPHRGKVRVHDGLPFHDGPAPLARVYVVDPRPSAEIAFHALPSRAAVMELVGQTYRLALDDRDALVREFDVLADVALRIEICRLAFPRALDDWRALALAIAADFQPASARARLRHGCGAARETV
jgi:energy-coupling factor transporter ATP-binding protein EcfA2